MFVILIIWHKTWRFEANCFVSFLKSTTDDPALVFQAKPSVIMFTDYTVGDVYEVCLTVTQQNNSNLALHLNRWYSETPGSVSGYTGADQRHCHKPPCQSHPSYNSVLLHWPGWVPFRYDQSTLMRQDHLVKSSQTSLIAATPTKWFVLVLWHLQGDFPVKVVLLPRGWVVRTRWVLDQTLWGATMIFSWWRPRQSRCS